MRRTTLIRPRDAAPELRKLERRLMLKSGLSLGALTMLTGCDLNDGDVFDRALFAMSHFNDRVQALLFSRTRLAATFPAVESGAAADAAAGEPDHAPYLHRGLEPDRRMERRAAACFPEADRRRHAREVRRLHLRGPLLHEPRHAERAASPDHPGAGLHRQAFTAGLRLSDAVTDSDQARLQERQARGLAVGDGYNWFSGT